VALLVAVALLAAPAAALADGDPASDYLITQRVFLPFDTKVPTADAEHLQGLVRDAARQGYPIRVALIGSDYDLGSVTVLWKQPQRYARFLGIELSFIHKSPLLVVMPKGMGFYWDGRGSKAEEALLAKIPVQPGGSGLAQTASAAVEQLAAAHGLTLTALKVKGPPAQHTGSDRLEIVAAVAVLLVVGSAARLLMLRRRRPV